MDDLLNRLWETFVGHIIARIVGPLKFRLVMQPLMAIALAVHAGLRDAREGRPPYFWALFTDRNNRRHLLHEGWRDVRRLFIFAIIVDFIYQIIVLHWVYLRQSLIVAAVLALMPYLLIRGPVNRIARRIAHRRQIKRVDKEEMR